MKESYLIKTILCLLFVAVLSCTIEVFKVQAQTISLTTQVALSNEYQQGIAANSVITVAPASVMVGNTISVTVRIIDEYKNILQGHLVTIGVISTSGVTLDQFTTITNSNGEVYGSIRSTDAGNFEVYAIDKSYKLTDNKEILLNSQPYIAFLSTPVNPIKTTLSNLVNESPTATASITPTIITPTPSITTTMSPTITPTPTEELKAPNNSSFNFMNYLRDLFGYNVCNNNNVFTIVDIIFVLFLLLILKMCDSKDEMIQYTFVYILILILAMFALKFLCYPLSLVLLLWFIIVLIAVKPLRRKIIGR